MVAPNLEKEPVSKRVHKKMISGRNDVSSIIYVNPWGEVTEEKFKVGNCENLTPSEAEDLINRPGLRVKP